MSDDEPDPVEQEAAARDRAVLQGMVDQLMRHFDTVQVFVTRVEPDGTTMARSQGRGNWYARKGLVEEWNKSQAEWTCSTNGNIGRQNCPRRLGV